MTQRAICECCGKEASKVVQDHDHFNGLNRDMICKSCNHVLTEKLQSGLQQYSDYIQIWENKHNDLIAQDTIKSEDYYKRKVKIRIKKQRESKPIEIVRHTVKADDSKVISIKDLLTYCKYEQPVIDLDQSKVIPIDELLTRRFT